MHSTYPFEKLPLDKRRSSSSAEEIVRAMAPKASGNTVLRAIGPTQMGGNQIGHNEMGPSDTINDIAALAALSDLDQDERIEKVKNYSDLYKFWPTLVSKLAFHFRPGTGGEGEYIVNFRNLVKLVNCRNIQDPVGAGRRGEN